MDGFLQRVECAGPLQLKGREVKYYNFRVLKHLNPHSNVKAALHIYSTP